MKAVMKKRLASWREAWWTSSELSLGLILNGAGCLALTLLVSHTVHEVPLILWWPYVIGLWAVWIAGALLIVVGVARVLTVDWSNG